jgi:hypothetical protein
MSFVTHTHVHGEGNPRLPPLGLGSQLLTAADLPLLHAGTCWARLRVLLIGCPLLQRRPIVQAAHKGRGEADPAERGSRGKPSRGPQLEQGPCSRRGTHSRAESPKPQEQPDASRHTGNGPHRCRRALTSRGGASRKGQELLRQKRGRRQALRLGRGRSLEPARDY